MDNGVEITGQDSELFKRLERLPPSVESPPGVLRATSAILRLDLGMSCLPEVEVVIECGTIVDGRSVVNVLFLLCTGNVALS